jgi:two-component system, NarL family, response regulator DegU
MKKIIIADDHPVFRSGIKSILEGIEDIQIVGEAADGGEAYQLIIAHRPDIAILDLEMPLLTGLEVSEKVLSEKSTTKFILLTMHKEKHYFDKAMNIGISGYLLKDYAINDLVACINDVKAGKKYASATIENYLVEHETKQYSKDWIMIEALLTPTEKVILKLIAEGKTSAGIAALLFVSPNTVDNHRSNLSKKLKLGGEKNALMKYAMKLKELLGVSGSSSN